MKFSQKELSRILSAHEGGTLKRRGEMWRGIPYDGVTYIACVIQAGKVMDDPFAASDFNRDLADWFDCNYEESWSADRLLQELESLGVA